MRCNENGVFEKKIGAGKGDDQKKEK